MKAPWAMACGWLVGCGLAVAGAGEYAWQPVAAKPAAPSLGVSLGRPSSLADAVSLSPPTATDPGFTRISYTTPTAYPVVRMQSADASSRLVPQPVLNSDAGSRIGPQTVWQRMPSGPPSSPASGFATGASGPVQSQPLTGFGCGDACCCGSNCCGTCCGPTCCDATCGDSTCCCDDPCGCCCPGLLDCPCQKSGCNWYTSAEYLLWFIRGSSLPPLVTASPAGTPFGQVGTLPGAATLFGGNTITNGPLSGGRFRLGYWFDDCRTCGLEGSFFFLAPRTTHFLASPTAALPNIGRPFLDPNGVPHAEIVAATNVTGFDGVSNVINGSATATTRADLYGAEINYRHNLFGGGDGPWRFDGLAGFRYLNLSENLNVTEQLTTSAPGVAPTYGPVPAGFSSFGGDSFSTQNQFYGGQVGYIFEYRLGRWVVNLRNTFALGNNYQSIQVLGAQVNTGPPGSPAAALGAFPGNLLTQRTNIGLQTRDRLSFVPELGVNLGYQVTDNLRLFVGYNFLLWTNVVRPADQIDRVVNLNNAPPLSGLKGNQPPNPPSAPLRPMPLFNSTNFWVQGVNLGLQYKF